MKTPSTQPCTRALNMSRLALDAALVHLPRALRLTEVEGRHDEIERALRHVHDARLLLARD